jgi:hypothetical protein
MVALFVLGTTVGLVWADTSDTAGSFTEVTKIVGVVGIVVFLIVLATTLRQRGRLS